MSENKEPYETRLQRCIGFAETNANYYRNRPGAKRLEGMYDSIMLFLIELRETRLCDGEAYEKGYRQAIADFQKQIADAFAHSVEDALIYGDGTKRVSEKDYDFQRDYNGQFKKGGSDNDRT